MTTPPLSSTIKYGQESRMPRDDSCCPYISTAVKVAAVVVSWIAAFALLPAIGPVSFVIPVLTLITVLGCSPHAYAMDVSPIWLSYAPVHTVHSVPTFFPDRVSSFSTGHVPVGGGHIR